MPKNVFTSKGIPLNFYVFPGPHRDFLVYLIEYGCGKVSSSIGLNETTINIALQYSDIPPNLKLRVLGADYITVSLHMGSAMYPCSSFVMCESYEYDESFLDHFENCHELYRRRFLGKYLYRQRPQTESSDLVAAGDVCVVKTEPLDDEQEHRPSQTGLNKEPAVSTDQTGISPISIMNEEDMNMSDQTDDAKIARSIRNARVSSLVNINTTSPNKVSQDLDTNMKELAQNTIAIDDNIDNGANERNSARPSSPKKRLSFRNGAQPEKMTESEAKFVEESKECYKSTFCTMKPRRYPYTREEQILILNYIKENRYYRRVKGTYIWKCLERTHVVFGRSWQSMAENFKKKILPNIDTFANVLNQREIFKFKGICHRNHRSAGGEGNEAEISSSTHPSYGISTSTCRADDRYIGNLAASSASAVSSTTGSPRGRQGRRCVSDIRSYLQ